MKAHVRYVNKRAILQRMQLWDNSEVPGWSQEVSALLQERPASDDEDRLGYYLENAGNLDVVGLDYYGRTYIFPYGYTKTKVPHSGPNYIPVVAHGSKSKLTTLGELHKLITSLEEVYGPETKIEYNNKGHLCFKPDNWETFLIDTNANTLKKADPLALELTPAQLDTIKSLVLEAREIAVAKNELAEQNRTNVKLIVAKERLAQAIADLEHAEERLVNHLKNPIKADSEPFLDVENAAVADGLMLGFLQGRRSEAEAKVDKLHGEIAELEKGLR